MTVKSLLCLAVGLSGTLRRVLAQIDPDDPDAGVRWIYPPRAADLTFQYLDTVVVSWTSYFDEPVLYTFCSSDSGSVELDRPATLWCGAVRRTSSAKLGLEKTQDNVEPFNGSKPILLDWTGGSPCWFNLRRNTSSNYGSNSEEWDYDSTRRSQTTLSAEPSLSATLASSSEPTSSPPGSTTSSASVSTESSSVSFTPANTGTTSHATPSPSSSHNGLTPGAQAGIGVGASLGGMGLGVLAALFWMRRRKQPSTASDGGADHKHGSPYGSSSERPLPDSPNGSPAAKPPPEMGVGVEQRQPHLMWQTTAQQYPGQTWDAPERQELYTEPSAVEMPTGYEEAPALKYGYVPGLAASTPFPPKVQ
ncbi:hypothetical protein DL769_001711 [Monosporascus sp. CRB-8-3]|nr:hypothetical protein DL769_001711 [Monosporascus sp. CRB-8-3]